MEGEPRWGRGWVSLGLWLGIEIVAFGSLVVATVVLPDRANPGGSWIVLGPHLAGLAWLVGTERRKLLERLRPSLRALGWGVGGGIGMILVGGGWSLLLEAMGAFPPDMAGYLRELVPSHVVLLLWGAVLVPVVEEGWFRGRLADAVLSRLDLRWAFLLSSVTFTAVHGIPVLFPAYLLLAAILFALRVRTGGLVAPIVAHALNNLWGLVVS